MKASPEFITTSTFIKITFLSISLIFIRKLFSNSYQHPPQLHHFSPPKTTVVSAAPPPQLAEVERTGIVDENGVMTADFIVGEFDPSMIGGVANETDRGRKEIVVDRRKKRPRLRVGVCDESMRDYVPCFDNVETNVTEGGENKYGRRCPEEGKGLNCLVPRPKGYKQKIPWPRSRDEVWFDNLPKPRIVEGKGGETRISRKNDKFVFPGEGTKHTHGAEQYLDHISKMVPEIAFGRQTQTALDIGCGVASFGALLLERNVSTLSIDDRGKGIQFALERGVPAMIAVLARNRLPYPSQAFDLIHCSGCNINWTQNDGILLLEVNRMLRAGGYFIWAAQPLYKNEDNLNGQWKKMDNLARLICWELVNKEGHIAMWRKPLNNNCYLNRRPEAQPPLCEANDDPDDVWYVNLKACITRLPEHGYGVNITTWPARLHSIPDGMLTINMDAYMARKDILRADSKYWKDIVDTYVRTFHWKESNLRNVMDMRARYGGFAAALHDYGIDCWVMNVVPVGGYNTLPVIYDRGLIGVMHDWCEPFDSYPRTYDVLNAAGLFSAEQLGCNISSIMLEMDRILRPGGRVYILDAVAVIEQLKDIAVSMGWSTNLFESIEGPHASWKLLFGEKRR